MKIVCSIAGYQGPATSLACSYVEDDGVLVVLKQIEYREARPEGFAMVSNLDLPALDFRFTEEHLKTAIQTYYTRMAQGLIDIDDAVVRYRPDNRIESSEITPMGRAYRIAPEIDNGQIGILAVCAFLDAQRGVAAAISMAADLADLYTVTSI